MLTVPQAALRAGKNPETIRRWIRAGKLPAWKVGTQHVIDEDDLANMVGVGDGVAQSLGQSMEVRPSTSRMVSAIYRSRAERSAQNHEAIAPYPSELDAARPVGPTADSWLPAIVGRIVRLVDPVRVILFGSRARGDARDDSDYDILVILDEVEDRRAMRIRIRGALDDLPIAKDVIVATADDVAGHHGRPWGVLYWARAEGRVVYERA